MLKILVNGAIRLPIMMSTRNAPVWMIANDNSNSSMVQAFTHSIMYGLLSSCPVEKLTFTIVDPENRGNSISPFFDAKKKLPELFGEKIYISKDEVAAKVSKLNEKLRIFFKIDSATNMILFLTTQKIRLIITSISSLLCSMISQEVLMSVPLLNSEMFYETVVSVESTRQFPICLILIILVQENISRVYSRS